MLDLSKLNSGQREAVEFDEGPCLIIASAGTGKTTTLVNRVAYLIDKGVNEENILLLTFTNKAANEMKDRACKMLGKDTLKLTACTYHSFCVNYLRKYAALLGINNNFTIIDSPDCCEVMKILKEERNFNNTEDFPNPKTLVSIFSTNINKKISISDILEIEAPHLKKFEGDILLLQQDYAKYKFEKNLLDYDDILVLFLNLITKNNKICKDISDVYHYIMVDEYQDSNSLQFDIIHLLRQFDNKNIMVVGDDQQCFTEDSEVYTIDGYKKMKDLNLSDSLIVNCGKGRLVKTSIDSIVKTPFKGNIIKITTSSGKILKATKDHIIFIKKDNISFNYVLSMFSGEAVDIDDYHGFLHKLQLKDKTVFTYKQDEIEQFLFDNVNKFKNEGYLECAELIPEHFFEFKKFGELIEGMEICVLDNVLGDFLLETIVKIEDEFYDGFVYDLNIPNYSNYLVDGVVVHNCIYGFRGSKFDNIMHFPDKFEGCKTIILDENYRSNQEILDVANILIDKAKEKYPKSLKGLFNVGRKPILLEAYNNEEEANYIIDEMEKLLCPPYNYDLKDIGILIRNSRDSYILESLLTKKYYTYEKFGGIKFLERTFVKDIFAFLKLSVNNKDELSWFRIFQIYPNIGIVHAKKMTEKIIENSIDELLDNKYEGKKYAYYFDEIHSVINHLQEMSLSDQLEYLINKYYFSLLEKSINASRKSPAKKKELLAEVKENKDEANILFEFAEGYTSTLKFLTDLTLETPERNKSDDKITISTVHSAKGLEWKVVFIMHCIEGSFPSNPNFKNISLNPKVIKKMEDDLEEERRVFYVAVTRAKDYLYLTYPKTSLTYDKRVEKNTISRFIDKDLKKCLEFEIKERTTWYW